METINATLRELTFSDLDEWAGATIRKRGQSYVKRVEGLRRTGTDELVAWVSGTEEYATLVHLDQAGEHRWFCTCPYDYGPCKHAVAVILAAAQQIKRQEAIPLLSEEDDLYLNLFGDHDEALEEALEEGEEQEVTNKGAKDGKSKVRKLLAQKNQEDLLELLVDLARRYPEVERHILESAQLDSGRIDSLVRALRKEIRNLTSEPAWYNPWKDEGSLPDYTHVREQLKALLAKGHADTVLQLGGELWSDGRDQVEQAHDEGETAQAIAACLEVVVQAVPKTSLEPAQQLLWLIERQLEDEFSLLESGGKVLESPVYAQAHWREVAEVLESRLDAMAKPRSSRFSDTYERQRLMNRLIQAYRKGGLQNKILPLLEKEAEVCRDYGQLVEALLAEGNREQARQWCIRGFAGTQKDASGIAADLQKRLREMAGAQKRYDLVAAYRAQDFFNHASLERYKELYKACEKVGAWPIVRAEVLGFLETGKRPDPAGIGDESATWPLPEPEVRWSPEKERRGYQQFPNFDALIEIALFEKRLDDVVALYQALQKTGQVGWRTGQNVAKAVTKTHPDVALAIWRGIVDGLIAQVKPKLYAEAGGYLRLMHKVYEAQKRLPEWRALLVELRQTHKAKRRLMEVLDDLSGVRKKLIE